MSEEDLKKEIKKLLFNEYPEWDFQAVLELAEDISDIESYVNDNKFNRQKRIDILKELLYEI